MVVQSTSTGGDLGSNHFDLNIPGGGVGIFDGCSPQFGGLGGQRYGGVSSRSECDSFPEALKPGCYWRFDWFKNADNPNFTFRQVQCPAELVARTGCRRNDDSSFPAVAAPAGGSSKPSISSAPKPSTSASPKPSTSASPKPNSSSSPVAAPKSTSTPGSAPKPATSANAVPSVKTSAPASPSKSPTPVSCVTEKYGQCGGNGFTGCKTCTCGTTCQKQNDWYSQCL